MSPSLAESERLKALIYGLLGVEPQALLGWGVCLLSAQEGEGKGNTNPTERAHKVLWTPFLSHLSSSDLLDRGRKILNGRSISFLPQPEADRRAKGHC